MKRTLLIVFILALLCQTALCKKNAKKEDNEKDEKKPDLKIGKKITDYNDADIHKLLDQWNENDDDYEEEEEDAPWKKPAPKVDMQKVFQSGSNKEDMIAASKKGQPLMMFANVAGNPTRNQAEKVTAFWQQSLQNAQIQVQRYMVSDNRVLFQLTDGSLAVKIKDFLVSQETCENVSFENLDFPGKGKGKQKLEL